MKWKQTKSSKTRRVKTIVGVAWYRPEQRPRLLEIAAGRESLHDTYAEWVAEASARFEEVQRMGIPVQKVEVDLDELVQWCRAQQQEINGEARSTFVAEKTRQLNQTKGTKKSGYV